MSVVEPDLVALDDAFAREFPELAEPWSAAAVGRPELVVLNEPLAGELGLDPERLRTDDGVALLVGNRPPPGVTPVAQAYAGHQFGGLSPRLGDGRALLLGELVDPAGRRYDLQLKGSGRTPFARGGDGRAALGPMLREYVIGEAMHALGIPTTRMLAVVATGEQVVRESILPGAVLSRVAASHLRVGTFQYAAMREDRDLLQRLVDHAIDRHHPGAADAERPALALFGAVVDAQADLVARWMLVGFVHGVLNTDNVTISGETIDYGPCAFMDAHDPATVFSSIDHGGRYAYGNQPSITQWNLARLAEALLPLLGDDVDQAVASATEVLETFPTRYRDHLVDGMRAKLGLTAGADIDTPDNAPDDTPDRTLVDDLLTLLSTQRADHTSFFRQLATVLRGDEGPLRDGLADSTALDGWLTTWRSRLAAEGRDAPATADAMDRVNPCYVPRNHLVEAALDAATTGDIEPFHRLVDVVRSPFETRPRLGDYAAPAPPGFGPYRTFCGT